MTSYHIQTRAKLETNSQESYRIEASGGELQIDGASLIACEFAKASIHAASKSGSLNDVLGDSEPLFTLRPLWMSDTARFRLPSSLEVDLPAWFQVLGDDLLQLQERCTELAASLFEHGLNTVIFSTQGDKNAVAVRISERALQAALDVIRAKGIKVALHFSKKQETLGEEKEWIEFFAAIEPLFDSFDYILWQAGGLWQMGLQPAMLEATEYEKAKEEVLFIEKKCSKPLIYFISSKDQHAARRQAEWLWALAHETGKETVLAFSAAAGSPFACHLPIHPIFHKLSQMAIISYPRLLPVMGVAEVGAHDFPHFAFGLYGDVLGRQIHGRFYGIACMIPSIPPFKSLTRLVLWVLGQRMWRPLSLRVFIEMWLKRHYSLPQCQASQAVCLFESADRLICKLNQLGELKNEIFKKKIEACTFALSELSMQMEGLADGDLKTPFLLFSQKMKTRIEEYQNRSSKSYKF